MAWCPSRGLAEIAAETGLAVVEDACQAPGAIVDGRLAGTAADVGVLSFGGSKLLTAGRGGALLTRRADIYQRAKIYGHRGNDAFPLSELQAAVLVPQLDTLDARNDRRRQNVARLLRLTSGLPGLRPLCNAPLDHSGEPPRTSADVSPPAEPSYYKLAWHYRAEECGGASREEFLAALQAEGLPISAGFRGFAGRGRRRCRSLGLLSNSRDAAQQTVLLHHPVLLADDSIDSLALALTKVCLHFSAG